VGETWGKTPVPVQTILVAAVGTFVGAWLTSRSQAKRRVVDELKAAHAAYNLCFSIINRALALKFQIVRPMKERYDEAVASYQAHRKGMLELPLDLQTLSQVKFPGELLEKIVFEKCEIGAKGLAAVVALMGTIDDLRNSIDLRNELISDFRVKNDSMNELQRIQFYVGAPQKGQIDSRFAHNIKALFKQTDDCIFFGTILADELLRSGNRLHSRNRFKYRLGISSLVPADWSKAKDAGLVPDETEYAKWTGGFKRPLTRWRWQRIWRWFQNWKVSKARGATLGSTMMEWIGRLLGGAGAGIYIILMIGLGPGWVYWLWMAIHFGRFWMFLLAFLGPTGLIAAGLGLWSLIFGAPHWLLHLVR
jgi:hypothetical protein